MCIFYNALLKYDLVMNMLVMYDLNFVDKILLEGRDVTPKKIR
jgi:hypothetical protein